MNNDFNCLAGYSDQDNERKRDKAVQAAMILINSAINPENPFKTLNAVNDSLITKVADDIQSAYNIE